MSGIGTDDGCAAFREHPAQNARPQTILGGMALAIIALAGAWGLYAKLAAETGDAVPTAQPVALTAPPHVPTFTIEAGLLYSARPLGFAKTFAQTPPISPKLLSAARTSRFDVATTQSIPPQRPPAVGQAVPVPTPRPSDLALAQRNRMLSKAAEPSPFERLLKIAPEIGPALAYAPTGGILTDGPSIAPSRMRDGGLTAIYEIETRTVHMPDGTKLEAHSGLGPKMDDPRYVHVKMHGATPPHVYDLAPREALFHGDEALRMHPVGGAEAIFGRTGLLTHSYLLGPNGQSNGCVSFKNYAAFLRAYKDGKVKRLIVVASLDQPGFSPALIASLASRTN